MSDPKPVRMWICVDGEDDFCLRTLNVTESYSWNSLPAMSVGGHSEREYKAAGYRCIRVTITPDPESEKTNE